MGGSVLVTGASGFIAKHVVRSLLDGGYEVRAVRSTVPNLGSIERVSNERAIADMDMSFIPPVQALRDAVAYLLAHDLV